jgi:N-acetylmuramoyl-L-alanine amidase
MKALPQITATAVGMRLPILRETRMPAVLCSLGPFQEVADNARETATAISQAFLAWRVDPHST